MAIEVVQVHHWRPSNWRPLHDLCPLTLTSQGHPLHGNSQGQQGIPGHTHVPISTDRQTETHVQMDRQTDTTLPHSRDVRIAILLLMADAPHHSGQN